MFFVSENALHSANDFVSISDIRSDNACQTSERTELHQLQNEMTSIFMKIWNTMNKSTKIYGKIADKNLLGKSLFSFMCRFDSKLLSLAETDKKNAEWHDLLVVFL